jgi:hypothetical protein
VIDTDTTKVCERKNSKNIKKLFILLEHMYKTYNKGLVSYFQEVGKFRYCAEVSGARPCAWSIHEIGHPGHRPAGTIQPGLLSSFFCVIFALRYAVRKEKPCLSQ